MSKKVKCPRSNCKNAATINPLYGVLPCKSCQDGDSVETIGAPIQYITIEKSNRIHKNWDHHNKDIIQPFDRNNKPNPDFVKAYPERRDQYFSKEQLSKL